MSDKDYVIPIEEVQSMSDAKQDEGAAVPKGTGSRRTSTSSQHSLPSCVSPNYDSGNYSCSNNSEVSVAPLGDSSTEDESSDFLPELGFVELTDDVKQLQKDLQEKNQLLLLAVTDARKMRSELERLVKSEQWYKTELKNQKRSRLELLEKLYLNERKFVEQNQKLKADCANLYSVCSELEKKALIEKDTLVKQLQELQRLFESTKVADENSLSQSVIDQLKFELQKQREFVMEKECLVGVLKKQKQGLLRDLDALTAERDTKILNLEASAFTLEQENRQITRRCAVLVDEKQKLEEDLRKMQTFLENTKVALQQRQLEIIRLREFSQEQLKEQKARTVEIESLKERVKELEKENIQEGCNNFKNLKLLESYKTEIEKKTEELEQLKTLRRADNEKISKLQVEIVGLEGLRENFECGEREKEQLTFQLQSKDLEIENLRIFQANQSSQIVVLQEKLAEYQRLKENFDKYVSLLQANNELLDAREIEIKNLKQAYQELSNKLTDTERNLDEKVAGLEAKEKQLQGKEEELATLQLTVKQQVASIQDLNKEIEWSQQIKQNLAECQQQLELERNALALKEKELENLTEVFGLQSEKLKELEGAQEENSKMRKDLENLNQELQQRSTELVALQELSSKQTLEIGLLNSIRDQVDELKMELDQRTATLNERDLEVETLRLVAKGQKAQIKRFNCKCAENEALRMKFEQASDFLAVDRKIFETEAAELEFLRNLVERQALEIGKYMDESDNHSSVVDDRSVQTEDAKELLDETAYQIENCFDPMEVNGRHDLEEKAHKIGLLKANLDKKCDKILQLNCEVDQWIELLKNLRISKSKSRESSSERPVENHLQSMEQTNQGDEMDDWRGSKLVVSQAKECSDEKNRADLKEFQSVPSNIDPEVQLDVIGDVNKGTGSIDHLNVIEDPNEDDNGISISSGSAPRGRSQELDKSFITLAVQSWGDGFETQVTICPPTEKSAIEAKSSQMNSINEIEKGKRPEKTRRSSEKDQNCRDCSILKKVMETEQRKMISKYEAHMHTVLKSVKGYRKKLSVMEGKYEQLLEKYKILELKVEELESENELLKLSYKDEMENIMAAKIRDVQQKEQDRTSNDNARSSQELEELSRKYQNSQRVIAVLKSQLETARNQFLEVDECKRVSLELRFNLDNFVESYKKLISPLDSYKSSIASDEIYDLINRSNSLVPNFDKLSGSIDALRSDIKKASIYGVTRTSPVRKLSLLDELRAADPLRFSLL